MEKARLDKMLGNDEIRTIITALGTGVAEEFSLEKLRYHKIVIMCDADVDGSHIRILLLTLFLRQLPKLIESGMVYIVQPPLYKVKREQREEYIQTEEKMVESLLDLGTEGDVLVKSKDKKEYNSKQLIELLSTLMQLDRLGRAIERRGVKLTKFIGLKRRHAAAIVLSTPISVSAPRIGCR